MVAPDYPGFGQSRDLLPPAGFTYNFENLSRTIEEFIDKLGLERFVLYVFDFGAPIGFRIAARRPDLIAGIIIQNANAYEAGLSDAARHFVSIDKADEAWLKELDGLLTLEGTKFQYFTGVADPEAISPDGYTLDQHYLDLPGRKTRLIDLLLDYKSNVESYPAWQAWLRRASPPAQVLWGRKDPLFLEAGAPRLPDRPAKCGIAPFRHRAFRARGVPGYDRSPRGRICEPPPYSPSQMNREILLFTGSHAAASGRITELVSTICARQDAVPIVLPLSKAAAPPSSRRAGTPRIRQSSLPRNLLSP